MEEFKTIQEVVEFSYRRGFDDAIELITISFENAKKMVNESLEEGVKKTNEKYNKLTKNL